MTLGHLAAAVHPVLVGLGGTARSWRVDRMATAVIPGTDRLNPRFAELAKHYGAEVAICPPHRPQRKGVVEAAIKYLTRSWWASARVETPSLAQGALERWCRDVADRRRRGKTTVAGPAEEEPLHPLPPLPFPARIEVERVVSRSPTRRSTPGTASTTRPPRTSWPAPRRRRWRAAGPPPCASGTGRRFWSSTSLATSRCPGSRPPTSFR